MESLSKAKNQAKMLTDMTPTAGQFYGSQIPSMGMNISNINHMQKPNVNNVSFIFFHFHIESEVFEYLLL